MISYRRLTLIFSLLFLISCRQEQKDPPGFIRGQEVIRASTDTVTSQTMMPSEVGDSSWIEDLNDLEENLFGKFYGERATFYIIPDPGTEIYDKPVRTITLYYLDGKHSKTKYVLEGNIADDLINDYRKFNIRGFDEKNRQLLKTEKIYSRKKRRWILNARLDNYEIQWILGNNSRARMRVNVNDSLAPYEYSVRDLDYEKRLTRIEKEESD